MHHAEHTFHTRHDFTPELGWAAFQLLAEFGAEGMTVDGLEQAAHTLASPMARRADLGKLLRSMEELGLLTRSDDRLSLSKAGVALAASAGRYEPGFFAGIHCLYAWDWLWSRRAEVPFDYERILRPDQSLGHLELIGKVFRLTGGNEKGKRKKAAEVLSKNTPPPR